jgi:hypothetical protein
VTVLKQPGARAVVRLTAAASRRAEPWTLTAIDLTEEQDGHPYVDLTLGHTRVSAGDTVTLTLPALRAPRAPRRAQRRRHRVGWRGRDVPLADCRHDALRSMSVTAPVVRRRPSLQHAA